jgi:hypothetical protein
MSSALADDDPPVYFFKKLDELIVSSFQVQEKMKLMG